MSTTPQSEAPSPARGASTLKRKRTREEMLAIFRAARVQVQASNPDRRDLLAELIAERRAVLHE